MQIPTWKLEDWRVAISWARPQQAPKRTFLISACPGPSTVSGRREMLGKVVSVVLPTSLAQGGCRNIGVGQGSFWLSEWDLASHGRELGM